MNGIPSVNDIPCVNWEALVATHDSEFPNLAVNFWVGVDPSEDDEYLFKTTYLKLLIFTFRGEEICLSIYTPRNTFLHLAFCEKNFEKFSTLGWKILNIPEKDWGSIKYIKHNTIRY